jgi:hypothetical protein
MDPETFEECETLAQQKYGLTATYITHEAGTSMVISSDESGYDHWTIGEFERSDLTSDKYLEATDMLCEIWFKELDKMTKRGREVE